MRRPLSLLSSCLLAVMLAACAGGPGAQAPVVPAPLQQLAPAFDSSDLAAAGAARVLSYHVMQPRTRPAESAGTWRGDVRKVYPSDLTRGKGRLMTAAVAYNVYVNCKTGGQTCWGDPEGFQRNLTRSTFAQLLTQYTASPGTAYTLGGTFSIAYPSFTNLYYDNDLMTILHAAMRKNAFKNGYGVMYHLFLPKGTATCFDVTRQCYSPSNPSTFNFCAYHETVRFPDIKGITIVSVEPYQDLSFCASRASSGASALTNSTASTLAHETFEAITDPGPGFAWFNFTFGSEIGDLCQTYQWKIGVNGVGYSLQPMYSNRYHACAAGP